MAQYTEQVVFRITAQEEQKLRRLTEAAMASPSELPSGSLFKASPWKTCRLSVNVP
jgi:hypothetical protein